MKERNGHEPSAVMTPGYGTLPARLNPGDDWTGGVRQEDQFDTYRKYNHFVVQIEDTMSDFPFRAEVDKASMWS